MPDVQVGPGPAQTLRFGVVLDDVDLGWFTGVKGLVVEHDVLEWAEGGENGAVHRLPGRVKYRDITVTRVLDRCTPGLLAWFTATRTTQSAALKTGRITAYDVNEELVAAWHLTGVWPLRYTGPTFDAAAPGAPARETLDLAHGGFTLDRSPS